jgi:tetratricopeptide (TPR) repeat protein
MEKATEILRKIENRNPVEHEGLIKNLTLLGDWRANLHENDIAIRLYEEALLTDPGNSGAKFKLLKLMLSIGNDDRALRLLEAMVNSTVSDADHSQRAALFETIARDNDSDVLFGTIFMATQTTALFGPLMEQLDHAISIARKQDDSWLLSSLLLHKGIAIYHYDKRAERSLESALAAWEESGSVKSKGLEWVVIPVNMQANRLLSSHHFQEARLSSTPEIHIEKLEQISNKRYGSGITDSYARSYFGCYYALHKKDPVKTKAIFLSDMKSALAFLSDDIEYNDHQGYRNLAEISMHAGDDLNALSAWSLLGPSQSHSEAVIEVDEKHPEEPLVTDEKAAGDVTASEEVPSTDERVEHDKESEAEEAVIKNGIHEEAETSDETSAEAKDETKSEPAPSSSEPTPLVVSDAVEEDAPIEESAIVDSPRTGPLNNRCDGRCGKNWYYADDFYCCKICSDVQLCSDCLPDLKAGKLKRFVCHPGHEWLHVPKWDDEEFKEVKSGMVKVGGTIENGKRIGGIIVPVEEWMNMLRDDWGISRSEALEIDADSKPRCTVS